MAALHGVPPRLVLFVEPDGGWAVATGAGLRARGWSVVWAADTATAVPAARQTLPDVVVLDAKLADGAERMLLELRACASTAWTPVLALVEEAGQQATLEAAGAQVCLPKPVDVDQLHAAVQQAVEIQVEVSAPPAAALGNPDRIALLRASGLLDGESDALFDALTALTGALLLAQSARVSLVSDCEQVFKARTDRTGDHDEGRAIPLSHSLCQWPVAAREPLVVSDARADPLLAVNRAVTDLGAVAYLGAPLLVNGQALGTLCVLDDQPRNWDPDELALLDDLAAAGSAEVRLRLADAGVGHGDGSPAVDGVAALAAALRRHRSPLDEAGTRALAALLEHFAACLPRA